MNSQKNIVVEGPHGKPILLDAYWQTTEKRKSIVIFAHGFKGFKDWGTWETISKQIVEAGFIFLKFNFSHNGTTPENPSNFGDLAAFGHNNYSIELDDLGRILNWVEMQNIIPNIEINTENISLIGHSRGGGVAIIKAFEDTRIKQLITWASVGTLDWMFKPAMVETWREQGVHIIVNGRTKQDMPLYFQLFEDFETNKNRFNTETALRNFTKPHLIIQGTNDPAIPVASAELHKSWNKNAKLVLINDADHVFGGSHPFTDSLLPLHSQHLVTETIGFLKQII
jgi:pimeloyl-ACP methyl ester carboxylesterase